MSPVFCQLRALFIVFYTVMIWRADSGQLPPINSLARAQIFLLQTQAYFRRQCVFIVCKYCGEFLSFPTFAGSSGFLSNELEWLHFENIFLESCRIFLQAARSLIYG